MLVLDGTFGEVVFYSTFVVFVFYWTFAIVVLDRTFGEVVFYRTEGAGNGEADAGQILGLHKLTFGSHRAQSSTPVSLCHSPSPLHQGLS